MHGPAGAVCLKEWHPAVRLGKERRPVTAPAVLFLQVELVPGGKKELVHCIQVCHSVGGSLVPSTRVEPSLVSPLPEQEF